MYLLVLKFYNNYNNYKFHESLFLMQNDADKALTAIFQLIYRVNLKKLKILLDKQVLLDL